MPTEEVKVLLGEGAQLFKEGKLSEAIAKLKAAVEADPSSVQAHSYLGAAYARDGQGPASVEQFQAAVDLDPTNAVHTFNLGQAFETAGSKPRATALYQQALTLDPKYARAQQRLDALSGKRPDPAPAAAAPMAPSPQAPAQTASMPGAPPSAAPRPMAPPAAAPLGARPPQYGPQPEAGGYGPPPRSGPPMARPQANPVAEHAVKTGTSMLSSIAACSVINLVLIMLGLDFWLPIGLIFTEALGALLQGAKQMGFGQFPGMASFAAMCLPIIIFVFLVYGALAYCASRGMRWAFITAVVLYSIDTLLMVLSLLSFNIMALVGAGLHIWALIAIARAIGAAGELAQARQQR